MILDAVHGAASSAVAASHKENVCLRKWMHWLLWLLLLNAVLVYGMYSVVQQNAVFKFYYRMIQHVLGADQVSPVPGTVAYNSLGQLIQYPGKTPVTAPVATSHRMVAFVFGQSNAGNHGGQKYLADHAQIFQFFDGQYYPAQDPLLGASGNSGSVWTLLANKLLAQGLYDQVLLIPAAIGGTSVSQWQTGGELHAMYEARLKQAQQHGLDITHFLWHQGESDNPLGSKPGIALDQYAAAMRDIIALSKHYFPDSKFYVATATRCFSFVPVSPELQAIQQSLSQQPGVYPGPNTDVIGLEDRYDDCHFSASGLNKHADGWVAALKQHP